MRNKRFSILIVLILSCGFAISQSKSDFSPKSIKSIQNPKNIASHARDFADAVYPTLFDTCSNTVFTFTGLGTENQPVWGAISGMNGYGDLEKAQKLAFTGSESYNVVALAAFFSQASVIGDGSLTMKIYSVDAETGGPGELLGTSEPLKVSELILSDTSLEITPFLFADSTGVPVSDSCFYASVDFTQLYPARDTVYLWQTRDGCGDGSNTWEKFMNETWVAVNDQSSWGLNFDILIVAVVEFNPMTNAEDYVENDQLRLYPAFPNPAREAVIINFGLETNTQVSIDLFDAHGKRIQQINKGFLPTGRHEEVVVTKNLPAGNYYYRIYTNKGQIISRFVIR